MTVTDEGRKLLKELIGEQRYNYMSDELTNLLAPKLAELAKAKADLGEIDRLLNSETDQLLPVNTAARIAAPYRIEADPLVEAFQRMPATFDAQIWAETARKTFADLGYELAKRGVTLP